MKRKLFLLSLILGTTSMTHSIVAQAGQPIAVVELFTSEGCSSCPPADKNFSQWVQKAERDGDNIFLLGYHVDYWNYLGWDDPFSKHEFSQRQHTYSEKMHAEEVYTPQIIINGHHAFGGNHTDWTKKYIFEALQTPSEIELKLKVNSRTKQNIVIDFSLDIIPEESLIYFALVENDLSSQVLTGENAGRTLKHTHVVRNLQNLKADKSEGSTSLALPFDIDPQRCIIISFIQREKDYKILGASQIQL